MGKGRGFSHLRPFFLRYSHAIFVSLPTNQRLATKEQLVQLEDRTLFESAINRDAIQRVSRAFFYPAADLSKGPG